VRAIESELLTILSIPLGPKDVLTTSATAINRKNQIRHAHRNVFKLLTLGSDDVGGADILGLLRLKLTGSVSCTHIIVILNFNDS
jgi:hypothetical protein